MRHDIASAGPISEGYKNDCSNLVTSEKYQRILLVRRDIASGPISEGYKKSCSNLVRSEKYQHILLVRT